MVRWLDGRMELLKKVEELLRSDPRVPDEPPKQSPIKYLVIGYAQQFPSRSLVYHVAALDTHQGIAQLSECGASLFS